MVRFLSLPSCCLLDVSQVLIEPVKTLRPQPAVLLDPVDRRVERLGFEVTRAKLGLPTP
jgi:hypothetical protein